MAKTLYNNMYHVKLRVQVKFLSNNWSLWENDSYGKLLGTDTLVPCEFHIMVSTKICLESTHWDTLYSTIEVVGCPIHYRQYGNHFCAFIFEPIKRQMPTMKTDVGIIVTLCPKAFNVLAGVWYCMSESGFPPFPRKVALWNDHYIVNCPHLMDPLFPL